MYIWSRTTKDYHQKAKVNGDKDLLHVWFDWILKYLLFFTILPGQINQGHTCKTWNRLFLVDIGLERISNKERKLA